MKKHMLRYLAGEAVSNPHRVLWRGGPTGRLQACRQGLRLVGGIGEVATGGLGQQGAHDTGEGAQVRVGHRVVSFSWSSEQTVPF